MMKLTRLTLLPGLLLLGVSLGAQTQAPVTNGRPAGTSGTVSSPSAPATAAAGSTDYRLVNGDKLRIEVYKDTQLSQSLQIRPDGKITLPLLGDITAAGRTSTELREAIAGSLKEYISNPVVTVIVVETVPQVVYVFGEVNSPGAQAVQGRAPVLQVLASAGGFKDFAKKGDIRIQRPTANGVQTVPFNYKDAVNGKGPVVYVQPGDTIIVP
jgi:polysaccharide export outer membrane protein